MVGSRFKERFTLSLINLKYKRTGTPLLILSRHDNVNLAMVTGSIRHGIQSVELWECLIFLNPEVNRITVRIRHVKAKSGDLRRIVNSKKINNEIVVFFQCLRWLIYLLVRGVKITLNGKKTRKVVFAFFNTMNTISNKLNLALSGLNLWPQNISS